MSIILDALRRAEREKSTPFLLKGAERRAAEKSHAPGGGFFHPSKAGLMAVAAIAAFAGGVCFAAATAVRDPFRPAVAEAMIMNDTAVSVSTAVGAKDEAGVGGEEVRNGKSEPRRESPLRGEEARNGVHPSALEETPAAGSVREQGAGPLGEKGEISPRITAGPVLPPSPNRNEPAGTEPPARPRVQAAPAPAIILDGIMFHVDPAKRTALLRTPGGERVLLNTGGRLSGCRVDTIGETTVTLALAGGKKIELVLE